MNTIKEIKETYKFTWGEPIKWHELGDYAILEYHPWQVRGVEALKGRPAIKTSFHGWIAGKDTNESWPTIETCIIGMIGKRYAGLNNGGVEYYFCKSIDAPPYDKKGE